MIIDTLLIHLCQFIGMRGHKNAKTNQTLLQIKQKTYLLHSDYKCHIYGKLFTSTSQTNSHTKKVNGPKPIMDEAFSLFFDVFTNLFLIISQNLRADRNNKFLPSWGKIDCCISFNFVPFHPN